MQIKSFTTINNLMIFHALLDKTDICNYLKHTFAYLRIYLQRFFYRCSLSLHFTYSFRFNLSTIYPIGYSSMVFMCNYTLSVINAKMLSFRVLLLIYKMSFCA